MSTEIVERENKILRETANEVPITSITTPKVKKVLSDMKQALASQEDGVAIAAPQIGIPLRIFVVSGRIIGYIKEGLEAEVGARPKVEYKDEIYINPVITKYSKEKEYLEEGCLSIRYLYGKVKRSKKVTIEAYDENGKFFTRGSSGLMAQIFQHETDHLNGILFIDTAKDVEEVLPEEMKARSKYKK
jgi:peptide deformylase